MLWRHLCLVRAWSAAGLLSCSLFGAAAVTPARAEPAEPLPTADDLAPEPVSVLDAHKSGDLTVDARGAGQDRVKITLKNTSARRLKVVIPPGLVASSATGQGGRGGGFQSMGLGSVSNRAGSFGAFRSRPVAESTGFRSVDVRGASSDPSVAVPAGQSIELTVVSVCLNFGVRTPNGRDKFELVDVDDYTSDPRARKALRSLATYGTSQGVAQAAMWRVCNDVPFALMAEQATKVMNRHEVALAARFIEAVDASPGTELVDPAYLTEGRLLVRVLAEGELESHARRLSREIAGLTVLGLPVQTVDRDDVRAASTPAVLLNVVLTASQTGETRGRVVVGQADEAGQWSPIGKASFTDGSSVSVLDGAGLARAIDRAVASALVSVKTARKASGVTTVRVENRLPFTLSNVTLKAGNSAGAPTVAFPGLGIAPGRSALVPVQAPSASVDRVEFNGL
jgi:hypothetical protein